MFFTFVILNDLKGHSISSMPCIFVLYGVCLLTVHVVVSEGNDFIITFTLNVRELDKWVWMCGLQFHPDYKLCFRIVRAKPAPCPLLCRTGGIFWPADFPHYIVSLGACQTHLPHPKSINHFPLLVSWSFSRQRRESACVSDRMTLPSPPPNALI